MYEMKIIYKIACFQELYENTNKMYYSQIILNFLYITRQKSLKTLKKTIAELVHVRSMNI